MQERPIILVIPTTTLIGPNMNRASLSNFSDVVLYGYTFNQWPLKKDYRTGLLSAELNYNIGLLGSSSQVWAWSIR